MSFLNPVKKDPRSYGQSQDVTWLGLFGAFGLAVCFQMFSLLAFSVLRRTKYGRQWLTPKRSVCPDQTPPDLRTDTLFGWMPQLWFMSEVQILMYCGYDAVMFLKFLRLGFWSLCYFAPVALFVILPCNVTAEHDSDYGDGYFVTTISNIRVSDKRRLPVHLFGMCLCQVILMVLTFNLHLEYIQLRRAFMKHKAREQTVLVTGIPARMRSTTLVHAYFDVIYGGAVKKVVFVKHIDGLDALVEKREATVLKLERAILSDGAAHLENSQPDVTPLSSPSDSRLLARHRSNDDPAPDIELAAGSSDASPIVGLASMKDQDTGGDSATTAKLRLTLCEQNKEVQRLQDEYAELSKKHERRMSFSANKILASNFNLPEDVIGTLATKAETVRTVVPRSGAKSADSPSARRRVVSVDQDEDVVQGYNSSFSLSTKSYSSRSDRLSEVADEGDYSSSEEEVPAPRNSPLPSSTHTAECEMAAESSSDADDDRPLVKPTSSPGQQAKNTISLAAATFGLTSKAGDDDVTLATKIASVDAASFPLVVNVVLVERAGEVVKVPLRSALMRIEYLKAEVEKKVGIKASEQVLHLRPPGKKSTQSQHELIDGRTLASHGVVNDSDVVLVLNTNPALLSTGEAPTSSRRKMLSVTHTQSALIRGNSGQFWGSRSKLGEEQDAETAVGEEVESKKNVAPSTWPTLPLTGSVTDFIREVRREEVKEHRSKPDPGTNSDKAFVTFDSVAVATIATQVVHSVPGHRQTLTVEEAPDANLDIFWGSVHKSTAQKSSAQVVTRLLDFGLVVFFVLPVAWMNGRFGPVIMEKHADDNDWPWYLSSLGTSLLPATLMIIANLLPPLFTGLGFFEGSLTWSVNSIRQLDRMAWFLLVNVFLVSIISGTVIQSLVDVLRDPAGKAKVVAAVLPTMSGFFTQYIMIKASVALSIEILRGLTLFHMLSRWLFQCKDATKRERLAVIIGIRRYNNPGWLPFGKHFAHVLLVMMICLSFAPIAPLIVIPGLIYFAYAQLVYRYSLCYVYEPRFEIGGGFWPHVCKWVIRMMYLSQFFMLSVFVLRSFFAGICGAFVMLFVTRRFQLYMDEKEQGLLKLPLEVAIYLDKPNDSASDTRAVFLAHVRMIILISSPRTTPTCDKF